MRLQVNIRNNRETQPDPGPKIVGDLVPCDIIDYRLFRE